MTTLQQRDESLRTAVRSTLRALKRLTDYQLPSVLNSEMLDFGERKEFLNVAEHARLTALVDFCQDRMIDKLQAEVARQQLVALFPEEADA